MHLPDDLCYLSPTTTPPSHSGWIVVRTAPLPLGSRILYIYHYGSVVPTAVHTYLVHSCCHYYAHSLRYAIRAAHLLTAEGVPYIVQPFVIELLTGCMQYSSVPYRTIHYVVLPFYYLTVTTQLLVLFI